MTKYENIATHERRIKMIKVILIILAIAFGINVTCLCLNCGRINREEEKRDK